MFWKVKYVKVWIALKSMKNEVTEMNPTDERKKEYNFLFVKQKGVYL